MSFIKTIALVPGNFVLVLVLASLWTLRHPRQGRVFLMAATAGLWVISTPLVGQALIGFVSIDTQHQIEDTEAGAIIALGGDFESTVTGAVAGPLTLERLSRTATAHRETGLPILVTAGRPEYLDQSGAKIMAQTLQDAFGVPVRWLEGKALSTQENAERSAEIMAQAEIGTVLVVTHRWHLRRARLAFAGTNLEVELLPVHRAPLASGLKWRDVMPTFSGLEASYYAGYELLGYLWYRLRA